MRLLSVVLCLAAFSASSFSESVVAGDCTVPAFSVDEDPKGLNIRKGPGGGHPVIGVVPNPGDELPPDIIVTGGHPAGGGTWLKVSKVDHEGVSIFDGEGWVFGRLVRTAVAAAVPKEFRDDENRAALYAKPDATSKEVGRVPGATEIEILACSGRWVKTAYEGRTGWLRPEDICGDPVGYCQ